MNVNIVGRKVTLKDNFKERVNKKLGKFERIFSEEANVTVTVTVEKNRQVVEVTIRDNGMLYRAESSASEMNDALDSVVDILGGQIRKNKAKLSKRLRADSIDQYLLQLAKLRVKLLRKNIRLSEQSVSLLSHRQLMRLFLK